LRRVAAFLGDHAADLRVGCVAAERNGREVGLDARQGPSGSTDTLYDKPFVDLDEWRAEPVRHRYVHGGFTDTDLRFSIYLPPP
jgi:hypothetical protein